MDGAVASTHFHDVDRSAAVKAGVVVALKSEVDHHRGLQSAELLAVPPSSIEWPQPY